MSRLTVGLQINYINRWKQLSKFIEKMIGVVLKI